MGGIRLRRLCTPLKLMLLISAALLFWMVYSIKSSFGKPWYYFSAVCVQPKEVIEGNLVVADKVHNLLTKQSVLHFLCYGALFGALRSSKPLPQDEDVDFCVLAEDMEGIEEGYLYQLFKFDGMTLSYNPKVGVYTATAGMGKANLVLFDLSDDYQWLQRIGMVNRLMFLEGREKFPSALAAPPLPTVNLGWVELPAPRGDIEIQKYLYPNDWWKEVKPPGC